MTRDALASLCLPLVQTRAAHYCVEYGMDPDELESAGCEGLMKAIKQADSVKKFRPFARAAINNAILDRVRREGKRKDDESQLDVDDVAETLSVRPSDEPDQEAMLSEAIDRLSAVERRAIELRFYQGMGLSDIATEMGFARGSVSVIISRALDKMREVMT